MGRRDRITNADQTVGMNYFCPAYQEFFSYAMPQLSGLCSEISQNHRLWGG